MRAVIMVSTAVATAAAVRTAGRDSRGNRTRCASERRFLVASTAVLDGRTADIRRIAA
jgi:hypothetical protein